LADGVARARAAGVPAYLETTNPRNVKIYTGAGWSVAGETTTADGTLPIWVLTAA
jgi:hypothetical protein